MKARKNTEKHLVVENLIKIRNERKLSQILFSELIDIDYSAYNKIESGHQKLSLDQLSKIAIKLKMSEIDIYTYPKKYCEIDAKNNLLDIVLMIKLKPEIKDQIFSLVFGNENLKLLNESL